MEIFCSISAQYEFWVARIGATRRGSFPSPHEQLLILDEISLHPEYIDNGFINDVALLRLEKPVTFSDYVRPVCLPSAEPKSGASCTVTGWGQLFEIGRIYREFVFFIRFWPFIESFFHLVILL